MDEVTRQENVNNLVRWAAACLKAFRSGHAPTFNQLDRLEGALYPFTTDKLCGHRIVEDCDCAELNGILHPLMPSESHHLAQCKSDCPCREKEPQEPCPDELDGYFGAR